MFLPRRRTAQCCATAREVLVHAFIMPDSDLVQNGLQLNCHTTQLQHRLWRFKPVVRQLGWR